MVFLATSAAAQSSNVGVSGEVGTLGAGIHLSLPVQNNLNARLGLSGYHYDYTDNTSDVNYDFKLKLQTIDALLDWYPMSGAFHLSAGIVHNGNKVTSVAKPASNGTYTINGNTYNSAEVGTIDGNVEFRPAAPYLGVGWGNDIGKEKGWGFTSDLGVMFQGSPSSNLTSSGCTANTQLCAQLYNDLTVENINLENKMNNLKYYPVFRVGITYSF